MDGMIVYVIFLVFLPKLSNWSNQSQKNRACLVSDFLIGSQQKPDGFFVEVPQSVLLAVL